MSEVEEIVDEYNEVFKKFNDKDLTEHEKMLLRSYTSWLAVITGKQTVKGEL